MTTASASSRDSSSGASLRSSPPAVPRRARAVGLVPRRAGSFQRLVLGRRSLNHMVGLPYLEVWAWKTMGKRARRAHLAGGRFGRRR
jgi:hypothetical protein